MTDCRHGAAAALAWRRQARSTLQRNAGAAHCLPRRLPSPELAAGGANILDPCATQPGMPYARPRCSEPALRDGRFRDSGDFTLDKGKDP
jgi:hypothetical protein